MRVLQVSDIYYLFDKKLRTYTENTEIIQREQRLHRRDSGKLIVTAVAAVY
jgi:hypothetical protein